MRRPETWLTLTSSVNLPPWLSLSASTYRSSTSIAWQAAIRRAAATSKLGHSSSWIPMSPPSHRRLLTVSVLLVFLLRVPGVHPQAPNLCGTKANGKYACADCSTSEAAATSNRGPTFESNLLRFRDSVSDMAARNASFLNATFAAAGDAPEDTVYGLATCLADAEASACAACLAAAAGELPGARCASRRDLVLWYPQCLVRYDNATFFGVADTSPAGWFDVPNRNNFSDPSVLAAARERLNGRMLAAAAESPVRFAFGDEQVVTANATATLHGLAQCTEDLTVDECARCLASNVVRVGACCADMDGVRINGASCYLRYEFMAIVPGAPPSMTPLVEPPPPSGTGGAVSTSRTRKKTTIYIVAGALGAAALLCLVVAGGFWLWKQKRRGSSSSESRKRMESLLQQHYHYPRRYSYAQVKRMTKSFADKLGQGGNGTVYRGRLPEPEPDGREVAVKMLKEEEACCKVDGEEFVNEVASISRTSHVNVVTLLGFCLEGCKRGLVYEYMPNGSLERYAVGGAGDGGGRWCLRWEQMLEVAVGVARGLEYLHRGCNAHIVHFDIKPHNILLDARLRPKISDFGLAKLCPQKESTIAVSIAGARGTAGYIAPEVFSRHAGAAVTSKSDVYSYGMMVLEMAGATRSTGSGGVSGGDDSGTGTATASTAASRTRYFPEWLYQDLDRFCAEAAAAAACGRDQELAEATLEVVRKLVIVGLWCIRLSPQDRPTMSRVVEMLDTTTTTADLKLPPGP